MSGLPHTIDNHAIIKALMFNETLNKNIIQKLHQNGIVPFNPILSNLSNLYHFDKVTNELTKLITGIGHPWECIIILSQLPVAGTVMTSLNEVLPGCPPVPQPAAVSSPTPLTVHTPYCAPSGAVIGTNYKKELGINQINSSNQVQFPPTAGCLTPPNNHSNLATSLINSVHQLQTNYENHKVQWLQTHVCMIALICLCDWNLLIKTMDIVYQDTGIYWCLKCKTAVTPAH